MIVGEAPGRVSLENRRAFSNPHNLTIRRAFARAIAPRSCELEETFYLTDIVKCWPASPSGANRSPSRAELVTCVERHLKLEFELIRPRLILTFGVLASAAALARPVSLVQAHGKPHLTDSGFRVIPFMHPSTANVMGLRRVGLSSLADYETQLSNILRSELRGLLDT
jgi:uracil-DNA glycosylase family 4